MKIYLSVPFEEKEKAKELGAKWDPEVKKWYAKNNEKELVQRWPELPPITKLQGEDRTFEGNRLFVDLVPRSCWFTNVRYCIKSSDWDRLRNFIYQRANNQCECCGEKPTDSLEAHERWQFDDETKTQTLMRIIAICKSCHEATHMGLSQIRGVADTAKQHLMKVSGMNDGEVKTHIKSAFDLWRERNKFDWKLNLNIITDSGIQLVEKVEENERKKISEKTLVKVECKSKNGGIQGTENISLTTYTQQYDKNKDLKRKFDVMATIASIDLMHQTGKEIAYSFESRKKQKQETMSTKPITTSQKSIAFIDLTKEGVWHGEKNTVKSGSTQSILK